MSDLADVFDRPAGLSVGDWTADAACRDADTDLFFDERSIQRHQALALCNVCPVRADCLDYAVDTHQDGIWGGTTERQRRAIRRERAAR